MHYKASYNDSLPPMPATNVTSDTLTHLDVPRSPTISLPSLLLLRTWLERVVGALLDVWSMFPTQMQIDTFFRFINWMPLPG
eukprot:scaffold9057_cov33-Attheya_sp.AAC.2